MNTAVNAAVKASTRAPTARAFDLLPCDSCGLVSHCPQQAAVAGENGTAIGATDCSRIFCPRCGAALHARKRDSLVRTWAYVIAAAVLYIPANALPIMETKALTQRQDDTILSGVVYLWTDGSWALALIVFMASIVIPMAKLIALTYLLISVQRGWRWRPRQRTRVYRLIAAIGRWSMLDIYVVAILAALVRVQPLALIDVGPGAVAFGAVVVLTMFATHAFDPRLIWDQACESGQDPTEDDD